MTRKDWKINYVYIHVIRSLELVIEGDGRIARTRVIAIPPGVATI
jgi:hypothetical protein